MTLLLGTIKATSTPQPMAHQLLEDIHNQESPELLAFIGKPAHNPSDWEYGLALMHIREDDVETPPFVADVVKSWIAT